jgi:uncharacterized membrane protein YhaH (DUF805 family)
MRELNPVEWAVLPLKKYANFSGRASRAEYWWFYLGTVIVGIVCAGVDAALGTKDIIGNAANVALLVPWLSVTVRRLHDIDRTGWWLLAFVASFGLIGLLAVFVGGAGQPSGSMAGMFTAMIVALVAVIVVGITMLVFMIQQGTEGSNRYGPDPYGPDNLEQVFA